MIDNLLKIVVMSAACVADSQCRVKVTSRGHQVG